MAIISCSHIRKSILTLVALTFGTTFLPGHAQAKPDPAPDVLVLSNGDTLHGKFVNEIGGKVTFHSDPLGDFTLGWDKIKELHTAQKFAILDDQAKPSRRKAARKFPIGTLDMADQQLTMHPDNEPASPPMPVKAAQFIMDQSELDKQINHTPGFFSGWNGAATAGATLVSASENQYTFSGGVGLVRSIPTVPWLRPRDRTSIDFTGSYGKIIQPAYTNGTVTIPAVVTKSAIYHAGAERDEYFAPHFFALGQVEFDHNFAQDLDLQQIYGGGLGWTFLKTPKHEADLKATVQYEKQQFITGGAGSNQDLIGSTFAATYLLHLKHLTYMQSLSFIPAYNNFRAYSATETNSVSFPAYKRLSFSVGTLDSYLNNPPTSLPPTKRNSFQFTMGVTYALQSK